MAYGKCMDCGKELGVQPGQHAPGHDSGGRRCYGSGQRTR